MLGKIVKGPAVANIDQALIVFAVTKPKPHLNLLDRFLIMMESKDIPVTLCFNKKDLAADEEWRGLKEVYETCGYPVVFTSALKEENITKIRRILEGKTTALAGPSGVGKSSLINLLEPGANMETGEISRKIERGRHTTRHSELFAIGGETYIMDTPGFGSLYVNDFEKEDLKYYFREFEPYEGNCKFQGCSHIHEPGCGVKDALETGKIPKSRYENYLELYRVCTEHFVWSAGVKVYQRCHKSGDGCASDGAGTNPLCKRLCTGRSRYHHRPPGSVF